MSSSYYHEGHANSPKDKMTKTEELRLEIAKLLNDLELERRYECKQSGDTWVSKPDFVKNHYLNSADQILKACQEAGLAFRVEDASLPVGCRRVEEIELPI